MIEIKCEKCGQILSISHWGNRDMAICNNKKCPAYRNPVDISAIRPPTQDSTALESFMESVRGRHKP